VKPNGNLLYNGFEGSIHQTAKHILEGKPGNGWLHWFFADKNGGFLSIDTLREIIRNDLNEPTE
jgi:hypothetical protein